MTISALLPAIAFGGATIFLFYRTTYWQQRREGRSHELSRTESGILSAFLLGSAAFDYVAVVANYS